MSLASLLLAGATTASRPSQTTKDVDQDLDALFRSNPAPPVNPPALKRSPTTNLPNRPPFNQNTGQKRKRPQDGLPVDSAQLGTTSLVDAVSSKAPKRKKIPEIVERSDSSSEDDAEDAQLEDDYLTRHSLRTAPIDRTPSLAGNSSDEYGDDAEPPMHETHTGTSASKRRDRPRKKTKYVPPEETPPQRDARTIFIGNIPVDVAKSKSSQKQLKRHFTSRIPGSKVESVRFRSVAFASATSSLPAEGGNPALHKPDTPSTKQQRQQERAAQWRESDKSIGTRGHEGDTSDREDSGHAKKPMGLKPAEKKRVAFIKGDFHKEVDTVNAYLVFAHVPPVERQAEIDTHTVHPFEAARLAVERCNGMAFLDHTIRVDRVGKWREGCGSSDPSVPIAGPTGDPRNTLFVGNLDFAAKEEELRVWFEGVVSQERGPPGEDADSEDDDEEKQKTWVRSVRIVRDRDTQLGKGFAYVQFADRDCVDELLALAQDKLKFAKRTLRVRRYKVVPGGSNNASSKTTTTSIKPSVKPHQPKKAPAPMPIPRGDPTLGTKLASLSKEERKAAKAANVDRVHRRLAKKKMGASLERAKEKEKTGGERRTRERERKTSGKGPRRTKMVGKGRVRSEKSMEKRNAKK